MAKRQTFNKSPAYVQFMRPQLFTKHISPPMQSFITFITTKTVHHQFISSSHVTSNDHSKSFEMDSTKLPNENSGYSYTNFISIWPSAILNCHCLYNLTQPLKILKSYSKEKDHPIKKKKKKEKLAGQVPIAAASVNRAEVVFHFQQLYIY